MGNPLKTKFVTNFKKWYTKVVKVISADIKNDVKQQEIKNR